MSTAERDCTCAELKQLRRVKLEAFFQIATPRLPLENYAFQITLIPGALVRLVRHLRWHRHLTQWISKTRCKHLKIWHAQVFVPKCTHATTYAALQSQSKTASADGWCKPQKTHIRTYAPLTSHTQASAVQQLSLIGSAACRGWLFLRHCALFAA